MKEAQQVRKVDALVVGAGFAGLYLIHKMRQSGLTVHAVEAAPDVGGTWFWNRYPGARCDIESMQYSYSFDEDLQQEWHWSERYASQPEILRYLNHVAERFDLRRSIDFDTRIGSARFDEAANVWTVLSEDGRKYVARYCMMATGCLSAGRIPDLPGLDRFAGRKLHTGDWPEAEISFEGRRVAVIGTGSSGIQAIPMIARQAEQLYVLQRTPNFSIPCRNWPMTAEYEQSWKADYPRLRRKAREEFPNGTIRPLGTQSALDVDEARRREIYEEAWGRGGPDFMWAFSDLGVDLEANRTAADFVRDKIAEAVTDPDVAESLKPYDYPIGAKRICVDTQYFETFNRPNVMLVDLRKEPIERVEEHGILTRGGSYRVDDIVFATGFDAITGALSRIDIRGRNGQKLSDKWAAGPKAFLGLMTAGFPNLFMITGPGSPSVLGNVVVSIEQHVNWLADVLHRMAERHAVTVETTVEAEDQWTEEVQKAADATLYQRAASWYLGANIPGKPRIFMPYAGGVHRFRQICDEVAKQGYRGLVFSGPQEASGPDAPQPHVSGSMA